MSLGIKLMRNLLKANNTKLSAAINKTPCYNFKLLTVNQPLHSNLVRFSSSSNNSNNSLKDSFNARKPSKQETNKKDELDDEDDVDYEIVKNIDQLKQAVLAKYVKEEAKYNGKLVYVGGLTSQLKLAKILSLSSSVLGIGLLPFLTNTLSSSTFFAQAFVYGTTGFFIFATPLLSQYLTRRYVSRMYYNYEEEKFKAVLFNFFLFEYSLEFHMKDVYMPDIPGVFSTLKLKNNSKRSIFVDMNQIEDVKLVEKIMGYDKPFDIRKYTDADKTDKKE